MKKRTLIIYNSILIVLVIGIVSMGLVLASLQATSTTGFHVTYSASNVNATISGKYTVGGASTTLTSGGQSSISFTDSDTAETVTKSFDAISDIQMTKTNDTIDFEYTIKNDSTTAAMLLTAKVNVPASSNLVFKYSENNSTWNNISGTGEVSFISTKTINANTEYKLYIKISIASKTSAVNANSAFTFVLNAA